MAFLHRHNEQLEKLSERKHSLPCQPGRTPWNHFNQNRSAVCTEPSAGVFIKKCSCRTVLRKQSQTGFFLLSAFNMDHFCGPKSVGRLPRGKGAGRKAMVDHKGVAQGADGSRPGPGWGQRCRGVSGCCPPDLCASSWARDLKIRWHLCGHCEHMPGQSPKAEQHRQSHLQAFQPIWQSAAPGQPGWGRLIHGCATLLCSRCLLLSTVWPEITNPWAAGHYQRPGP